MEIIRGIERIRRFPRPAAAIGVFDGLHAGHAAIIKRCVRTARAIRGTSVVVTFYPHPQNEESIYSLEHRLAIIARLGVDACIVIRFNRQFARMAAGDFITRIIAGRIGAKYVMVGENFRFGKDLAGSVATLRRYGELCGYTTVVFPICTAGGRPVSSTRIRACIAAGRFAEAERMLGRKVSILGKVIRGRGLGRELGYPTANLSPQHEVVPPDGIYAVTAFVDGREFPGACYKGSRPTFGRSAAISIEIYLFGFSGNLYGKQMEVRFYRKIRSDKKFPSRPALISAIKKDIATAKHILASR
jgi:riboflavin kinase / FMN adenylyltransferase